MCWSNLVSVKCHNAKFNVAKHINLYFRLRFGLVKAIIAYLRFKICILWGGGIFHIKCMLIEFTIPKLSVIYFYLLKSLNLEFQTSFWQSYLFSLCVYLQRLFYSKKWFKILVSKLSDLQNKNSNEKVNFVLKKYFRLKITSTQNMIF